MYDSGKHICANHDWKVFFRSCSIPRMTSQAKNILFRFLALAQQAIAIFFAKKDGVYALVLD